ncbi:MAG: hypothetical protein AXA67_00965 [Methylothermaceae bacteria B42]|nr:MAG: hypothetical protein AXA67_00965 [Methylothermaceae bacteria B42]HHJ38227.1 nucleotidyltransferase domain-containing protein [Methylothermaceae bacterium]
MVPQKSKLNEETLRILQRILATYPEIRLALVFGSLAEGKGRPESDLDLAVDAGSPLLPKERFALVDSLAEALGRPVDLIDLHRTRPGLLGQILRTGVRIKGTAADQAYWMTRCVVDSEDFLPGLRALLAQRRKRWIGG